MPEPLILEKQNQSAQGAYEEKYLRMTSPPTPPPQNKCIERVPLNNALVMETCKEISSSLHLENDIIQSYDYQPRTLWDYSNTIS